MREYPGNIASKLFIVSIAAILWLIFQNPNPPIYEHNDIEETIDVRGVESTPVSMDLADHSFALK